MMNLIKNLNEKEREDYFKKMTVKEINTMIKDWQNEEIRKTIGYRNRLNKFQLKQIIDRMIEYEDGNIITGKLKEPYEIIFASTSERNALMRQLGYEELIRKVVSNMTKGAKEELGITENSKIFIEDAEFSKRVYFKIDDRNYFIRYWIENEFDNKWVTSISYFCVETKEKDEADFNWEDCGDYFRAELYLYKFRYVITYLD